MITIFNRRQLAVTYALEEKIHIPSLPKDTPLWCAQWGSSCDWPRAKMWQYTDCLPIGGKEFDGNYLFK